MKPRLLERQKEEGQPCARCGRYLNLWSNGLCPDCTQVPETVKPKEEGRAVCPDCGQPKDKPYCQNSRCKRRGDMWPCPTCGDRLATINQRCPRCTASIEEDRLNRGE